MGTISAKEPALLPLTFSPMQIYYFLSIQLNPYSAVTIQEAEVPLNKVNQRVKPGDAMLKANS